MKFESLIAHHFVVMKQELNPALLLASVALFARYTCVVLARQEHSDLRILAGRGNKAARCLEMNLPNYLAGPLNSCPRQRSSLSAVSKSRRPCAPDCCLGTVRSVGVARQINFFPWAATRWPR